MTATEVVVRHREFAASCLLFAKRLEDANEKLVLIDMAQA
jgi:hypothetical protein